MYVFVVKKNQTGGNMNIKGRINRLLKVFLVVICLSAGTISFNAGKQETAHAAGDESVNTYSTSELDIIILDKKGYKKDRKGPVTFFHQKHARDYDISCWECHHVYAGDENIYAPWEKTDKCIECHDPLKEQGKVKKLQPAFHLSCRGCHEKLKIYDNETSLAYKKCNRCHDKIQK